MSYTLSNSYTGQGLVNGFDWVDGPDLSHGFVSYQNQQNAQSQGLFSVDPETQVVRLGVDHTNTYSLDQGRPSVRLESKQSYNHGLFIADFLHMPSSQCGVWPAFWTYGPNWPYGGELDILEGADTAYRNIISGHTADGCTQDPSIAGLYTGNQRDTQCAVGDTNIGCGFDPPVSDTSSYGDGFNAVNGGVYAMQWDSQHIRVWHFPRGSVPADIEAKQPQPENWGMPEAIFGGSSCDVDSYWKDMKLVINTNFCGDYGNAVWDQDGCNAYAPTCAQYVASNPDAFANTYWDIKYIDAYQYEPSSGNTAPNEPTATAPVASYSTATVGVGGSKGTLVYGPAVTGSPSNPVQIDNFSHLGCYGSSSNFKTFKEVADRPDMSLELCVQLCHNKKFAGVFESKCYCAHSLDAGTRAQSSEQSCNAHCPGSNNEFCGGTASCPTNSTSAASPTLISRHATCSQQLLTVYGAVMEQHIPAPPPMATGLNITTVTYTTVCPSQRHRLIQQEYVATVTVQSCGCEEDKTKVWVPMKTTVASCSGCGPMGENHVTLTVPAMQTMAAQPTSAVWTPVVVANQSTPAEVMSEAYRGWGEVKTVIVLGLGLLVTLVMGIL